MQEAVDVNLFIASPGLRSNMFLYQPLFFKKSNYIFLSFIIFYSLICYSSPDKRLGDIEITTTLYI
jgi:hypothetical protein